MTQEQLRMQFLSGVITESEYKVKLIELADLVNEDAATDIANVRKAMEAAIAKIKNPADIERRINNVKFVVWPLMQVLGNQSLFTVLQRYTTDSTLARFLQLILLYVKIKKAR